MAAGRAAVRTAPVPQQDGGRHQRVSEAERGHRERVRDAGRHVRAVAFVWRQRNSQEGWYVLVEDYILENTNVHESGRIG